MLNKALVDNKIVTIKVVEDKEHSVLATYKGSLGEVEIHKDECFTWSKESHMVSFEDEIFSFWGCSKDKVNKVFILADDWSEAREIKRKLTGTRGVKRLSISKTIPKYDPSQVHVSLKTKYNCGFAWWYEQDEVEHIEREDI